MVYKRTPRDPADCPSCYHPLTRAQYMALIEQIADKERKEQRAQKEKDRKVLKDKDENGSQPE